MLDRLEDFEATFPHLARGNWEPGSTSLSDLGELYCPPCGGVRRMDGTPCYYSSSHLVVVELSCTQCDAEFVAVWYANERRNARLAILPKFARGGISTPHTPPGVAYYLGQASLAQSVGANSAAVAMYRAATEQVLLDQGYLKPMLGPKINALEADIAAGNAKPWAADLDTDYLRVLKDLGNASIHAGDIAMQATFDTELLAKLSVTLHGLLFVIYEAPQKKQAHLHALRQAVALVKK